MIRRPPRSTLFPYTTLFRSDFGEQQRVLTRGVAAADDEHVLARDRVAFEHPRFEHAAPRELLLAGDAQAPAPDARRDEDRKSTRLNSSHANISYAAFCLKKK